MSNAENASISQSVSSHPDEAGIVYRSAGLRPWLRPFFWRTPLRYWLVGCIRQRKNILSPRFDIIVDGFPRSANTFAVEALTRLQRRKLKVRSHLHSPAAVIAAVQMGRPALVLVRKPVEAIASAAAINRFPLRYNISGYIEYYNILLCYGSLYCVADFDEVTNRFDLVIRRINAKFGLGLDETRIGPAEREMLFRTIDTGFHAARGRLDEVAVSRPSTQRKVLADQIIALLRSPKYAELMQYADAVYARFRALCQSVDAP